MCTSGAEYVNSGMSNFTSWSMDSHFEFSQILIFSPHLPVTQQSGTSIGLLVDNLHTNEHHTHQIGFHLLSHKNLNGFDSWLASE